MTDEDQAEARRLYERWRQIMLTQNEAPATWDELGPMVKEAWLIAKEESK